MSRYTLVLEDYKKRKILYPFPVHGKNNIKVPLPTIDQYTLTSINLEAFLRTCNPSLTAIHRGYIIYKANRQEKQLPIAFQDKSILGNIKLENDSTIKIDDRRFQKFVYDFLKSMRESEFYRYFMKNHSFDICQKLKEDLIAYLNLQNPTAFELEILYKRLINYKQFREIVFAVTNFEKEQIEEDEYDPDRECFLSEEEKRIYQAYMDSLPDENYVLEDERERRLSLQHPYYEKYNNQF